MLPPGPFHVGHSKHRPTDSDSSVKTTVASDVRSPSFSSYPSPQLVSPTFRSAASTSDLRRMAMNPSSSAPVSPLQQPRAYPSVPQPRVQAVRHRSSIMSMATEQELLDLAEILSPTVDVDNADALLDEAWSSRPQSASRRHRISVESNTTSLSSLSTLSSPSIDSTDYCDSAYLSSSSPYPSFHLPRVRHRNSSDAPSLATSDSLSTLSSPPPLSPPMSRTPSFQQASPVNSKAAVLPPPNLIAAEPMIAGLDVIHEQRISEEMDHGASLRKTLSRGTPAFPHSPSISSLAGVDEYTSWYKREQEEFGQLRIRADSPETIIPVSPAVSVLSSSDTSSTHAVSKEPKRGAFLRLFGKHSKNAEGSSGTEAHERNHGKQSVKGRTERLAQQFQAQADAKRGVDGRSTQSSGNSSGNKQQQPAWEEDGGIYSGVGW